MAILAVSREYGSGGRDIGRLVAKHLGYEFVDKQRLFQDLDKSGARWGRVSRELDEVCPTLWERHDWQYRGYVALMESLIFDYAARDKVVIIGRGGFFLLREVPFCLTVRLVAPLDVRLERILVRESLDRDAAQQLMSRVDNDRACYLKANYGIDWRAEDLYDLVLNTGHLSYEQVADLLVQGLADKERQASPEARSRLQDEALARRLKARLATDGRLLLPTLEVSFKEGALLVTATIHTPKEQHLIQEITRDLCGARAVRFDLHHRV
jgi:cytidylate kinase